MEHISVLFVAVGFYLITSHLFVQSLPIKYHEKKSKDKTAPIRKEPADSVGLVMFPMLAEVENKVQDTTEPSKTVDQSSDNSSPASPTNPASPANPVNPASPASTASTASTHTTKGQTEMTIAMPEFKTDSQGNYIFPKLGKPAEHEPNAEEDEGLKAYNRGRPPKQRAPAAKARAYNPPFSNNVRVCAYRSTIYNFPKTIRYLNFRIYTRFFPPRPVWMDLREEIYKDGNSQECHQPDLIDWNVYINCAIRRNMRMEYLVPKYPLSQTGYYFNRRNTYLKYI